KDVKALAHMAENGYARPQLLHAVLQINQDARRQFISKTVRMLGGDVQGKRVGVLGLSFKPDTDDMRESPAIEVVNALIDKGAELYVYDPIAMEAARPYMPRAHFCTSAYEVATGADALLLITAWNEFKQLDLERVRDSMKCPVLVDGRNVYDPIEMREVGF